MANNTSTVAKTNGGAVCIFATLRGANGIEYSLSLPKRNMDTSALPSNCVSSLVNKRILENEANTATMTVVDTTAYDVENLLMGMSEDMKDRLLFFQYGYNTNLSKVYKNLIYSYKPQITSTTTSLEIESLSDEPRGTKATTSSSYGGGGGGGGSSANRDTAATKKVLNYVFTLKQNSAMRGQESNYVSICNKYGIDPLLGAAINVQETGWYTSYACLHQNNIGGMMVNGRVMTFSSLQEGIDAFASNLKRLYYDYGLTTPETIGPKYCVPPDHWITAVRSLFDQFVGMYNSYGGKSLRKATMTSRGLPEVPISVMRRMSTPSSEISYQGIYPTSISDIFKVICDRNGWKYGNIEETRPSTYQITQYNISDIDFIKTKLRPNACSRATGEYGYVFYLSNIGNDTYANFHIPKVSEEPNKAYAVSLNSSGGIMNSREVNNNDYRSIAAVAASSRVQYMSARKSSIGDAISDAMGDIISSIKETATETTKLNEGKHITDDKFNYGTNESVVLSWSPQVSGAYLLTKGKESVEYSMLNETGDELKSEAIDAATDQYDNSRELLGQSNTTTIKRSSSFSKIDSGNKAMTAWYNASKYMHLCTAEIVGDHSIHFGDTIDWNIFLQGKVHYTSGRYLTTEVIDTINSDGFTTKLTMVKNAKNGGRIGQEESSGSYTIESSGGNTVFEREDNSGGGGSRSRSRGIGSPGITRITTTGQTYNKVGLGAPPSDLVKVVGNGLGTQVAIQARSDIADPTTVTQKNFKNLYGK